jgi:hypothetical protein
VGGFGDNDRRAATMSTPFFTVYLNVKQTCIYIYIYRHTHLVHTHNSCDTYTHTHSCDTYTHTFLRFIFNFDKST